MTSTGSLLNKPKSVVRRIVNVLFAVVLMLLGAALMITSYQQVDADEELARTGVHVAGTITYFSDARKASNRDITVEFVAADGVNRYAHAPLDHEQHPYIGEQVTVSYREQQPDQAVVLGYGSNREFLGGVGLILTVVLQRPASPSSFQGCGGGDGPRPVAAPGLNADQAPTGLPANYLVAAACFAL